jgi:hypothetical protein
MVEKLLTTDGFNHCLMHLTSLNYKQLNASMNETFYPTFQIHSIEIDYIT